MFRVVTRRTGRLPTLPILFSTNDYSDTVLAEWDAISQTADVVNEMGNVGNLPVRLVTTLNTYHEQPLPVEDPDETTQTWAALQDDLLSISTNREQTMVEEATHFSLLVNPNHAIIVSEAIIEFIEDIQ